MADQRVNITLAFQADTKSAQKELKTLDETLKEIIKLPTSQDALIDDQQFKKASKAAEELRKHMSAALNPKTGNIDLSRLSTSLKAAGTDLSTLTSSFRGAGTVGEKAFLQVASAVSKAEAPVVRINKKLESLGHSFKNTVKWQISSTVLHGFMGSLQSAYGYAQDLNKSLNNIRIVTGKSVDEMARFAEEANKAAKSLSTTTTAYTDAALIFYQQGAI